jgi:AbrB family looped-hinge helix DNA binding protein
MYATVTSKGQITLPAAARRAVGIRSGQKVAIHVGEKSLRIDAPTSIEELRVSAKAEAESVGTSHIIPTSGDGWEARAEDFRANR